jgi:hypothetical protein
MKKIIKEAIAKGLDGYTYLFSKQNDTPYGEVTSEQRQEAKMIFLSGVEASDEIILYNGYSHISIIDKETPYEVTHFIRSGHTDEGGYIWYFFIENAYDTEPEMSGINAISEENLTLWFKVDLSKLLKPNTKEYIQKSINFYQDAIDTLSKNTEKASTKDGSTHILELHARIESYKDCLKNL